MTKDKNPYIVIKRRRREGGYYKTRTIFGNIEGIPYFLYELYIDGMKGTKLSILHFFEIVFQK